MGGNLSTGGDKRNYASRPKRWLGGWGDSMPAGNSAPCGTHSTVIRTLRWRCFLPCCCTSCPPWATDRGAPLSCARNPAKATYVKSAYGEAKNDGARQSTRERQEQVFHLILPRAAVSSLSSVHGSCETPPTLNKNISLFFRITTTHLLLCRVRRCLEQPKNLSQDTLPQLPTMFPPILLDVLHGVPDAQLVHGRRLYVDLSSTGQQRRGAVVAGKHPNRVTNAYTTPVRLSWALAYFGSFIRCRGEGRRSAEGSTWRYPAIHVVGRALMSARYKSYTHVQQQQCYAWFGASTLRRNTFIVKVRRRVLPSATRLLWVLATPTWMHRSQTTCHLLIFEDLSASCLEKIWGRQRRRRRGDTVVRSLLRSTELAASSKLPPQKTPSSTTAVLPHPRFVHSYQAEPVASGCGGHRNSVVPCGIPVGVSEVGKNQALQRFFKTRNCFCTQQ